LLVLEEAPDRRPLEHRRGRPPDVAGLDPVLLGGAQVDLDAHGRLDELRLDTGPHDAADAVETMRDLFRFRMEDLRVLAEDPDVDGCVRLVEDRRETLVS